MSSSTCLTVRLKTALSCTAIGVALGFGGCAALHAPGANTAISCMSNSVTSGDPSPKKSSPPT